MLVRRLDFNPELNRGLSSVSRAIVSENMWRAQRRGIHASFIDEGGNVIPFADNLEAILDDIAEDADILGCSQEIARARTIVSRGTSADCQLAVFAKARASGGSKAEALAAVIDWMAETTVNGEEVGSVP